MAYVLRVRVFLMLPNFGLVLGRLCWCETEGELAGEGRRGRCRGLSCELTVILADKVLFVHDHRMVLVHYSVYKLDMVELQAARETSWSGIL